MQQTPDVRVQETSTRQGLTTLAIVGRSNVGKSTLFNRLTHTRDALVADQPGLTRDRHYGLGRLAGRVFGVVDTGGFEPHALEGVYVPMAQQTLQAVSEADAVLLVVDARVGVTVADRELVKVLRRTGRSITLVVNKAEGLDVHMAAADFHELGIANMQIISAAHGRGVSDMVEAILSEVSPFLTQPEQDLSGERAPQEPRLAIIGRPNVGKSTLANALLGEQRMVVWDEPGTTRDAVETVFSYGDRAYRLVDTAGLKRRAQTAPGAEKLSAVKTLQMIERSQVVMLVVNGQDALTEQDAQLAHTVVEAGRALVLAVNKWDAVTNEKREEVKQSIQLRLRFIPFVSTVYISALKGRGLKELMGEVANAQDSAGIKLSTPQLTRVLRAAVQQQEPPRHGLIRPKLRYAHQGGMYPPLVIVHGNATEHLPSTYHRYLVGVLRKAFNLSGTPLRLEFRSGQSPFSSRSARK